MSYSNAINFPASPHGQSLPDVLSAIGEGLERLGALPEGEFSMAGLDLEVAVDEYFDAFSNNMAVCSEKLSRWLRALRRCALKVITSLVEYLQSGSEVIQHSQELADYLAPAYYAPDYLDIDGMKEFLVLLGEAEVLEGCFAVGEQRTFFHEFNHQLDRAAHKVHDALMGNMPDRAYAMRRKVARLRSDVQDIIRREEKGWEEALLIDPNATREELLREAMQCVEEQLTQSTFYCQSADTPLKAVEHILSLSNERIGAQLDHFLYLYAQMHWLSQQLTNAQCTIHNAQLNDNSQINQEIHMEVHITNQEGGIIQYTDKPINNFFASAEETIKIYQGINNAPTLNPSPEGEENSEAENTAPKADVLLKYCPDREQCSIIATMLRGCTRASQLVTGLLNIDGKGWIEWSEMNTADFRTDILPLLGFDTTESAIKMAMRRRS